MKVWYCRVYNQCDSDCSNCKINRSFINIYLFIAVLSRRTLRRLEAEAAEHAREEREGLVSLRLSLADIFSKGGVISTRLDDPIKSIQGLEVTISVATPLMPDHLLRELNPLTITVVKATGLPNHPVSHQQLRKKWVYMYIQSNLLP